MKYIIITEVDVTTKIPCTVEPQRTGPSFPNVKGLNIYWADESSWPVGISQDGRYLRAPKYYGTCDDDADITLPGVLEVLTEQEWLQQKHDEFYARQPYPSWVWHPETLTWLSPVPYPSNANENEYRWDEETKSWVLQFTNN